MFIEVKFTADSPQDFMKLAEIMKIMGGVQDVKVETTVTGAEPSKPTTKPPKKEAEKPVVAQTSVPETVEATVEATEEGNVEPETQVAPVTGQVVTSDMVRALATSLIQKNKTKDVNAVINKYAPKISELTELQYVSVYNQLKEL